MKFVCDYCKNEYITYYGNRGKHNFCSKECFAKFRNSKIKTNCLFCNKEIFVRKNELNKSKHFCSMKCANNYQSKDKIKLICKICQKLFYRSKSWLNNKQGYYCSIECRNKDEKWKENSSYKANYVQNHKKGLNKLELKGNNILDKLNLKYENQVMIENKFCVDVFIKEYKLIIQWDGNYWHGKNVPYEELDPRQKKRVNLDNSQDKYLSLKGYNILRFWEDEVYGKEEKVSENIIRRIREITK